ncbi:MAG: hypothetical protein KatS3mg093_180 [Candidatus Parcubacteria bacterium]|nr:MAG: hypothetical protein KatS3mg093_180 [Candidatus Parcubacteria bacterium]
MTNNTLITNNIKKILETKLEAEKIINLKNIPGEELKTFLTAFKIIDKALDKIDFKIINFLNKEEIRKWALIYILIHDLFHETINNENYELAKLEIYSTAPIFYHLKEIGQPSDYQKLIYAYFSLSFNSLIINHRLENLISEKIILGEFFSIGGLENGLWGIKLKENMFEYALESINEKFKTDKYSILVKRYTNFNFDFLH